jgi:preprotein translocase subunit SecG
MLTFILIIAILIGVLLIIAVLVQNPKGSGLAANFSSGNQFFGVKKTTEMVEKATWAFAVIIMLIAFLASAYLPKGSVNPAIPSGNVDEQLESIRQKGIPTMPTTPPAENKTEEEGNFFELPAQE